MMDPDEVFQCLEEQGVIVRVNEVVAPTNDFTDTLRNTSEMIERVGSSDLARQLSENYPDLPNEAELQEMIEGTDLDLLARYVSVRSLTGLSDRNSMQAAVMLGEFKSKEPVEDS